MSKDRNFTSAFIKASMSISARRSVICRLKADANSLPASSVAEAGRRRSKETFATVITTCMPVITPGGGGVRVVVGGSGGLLGSVGRGGGGGGLMPVTRPLSSISKMVVSMSTRVPPPGGYSRCDCCSVVNM